MLKHSRKLRTLAWDLENRPLSYWGENGTAEITASATCWSDDIGSMEVFLLGKHTAEEILEGFLARYNEADIITGHNIRGHDLPLFNGSLLEYGYPKLAPKLSQDTYLDMYKRKGIPASQEYLVALLGVGEKVHMSQHDWRSANRLTPEGLKGTERRVIGDVVDHMRLRPEMVKRGLLKAPRMWYP